jgi:hypothetical protein
MEHRGSEGIADLLEPTVVKATGAVDIKALNSETTPDQMSRARPDLTTGELKMPVEE